MPDPDDDEDSAEEPSEQSSMRWRMTWFFVIAAAMGVAFAAALGLFRTALPH
jgi:hypothetical protein